MKNIMDIMRGDPGLYRGRLETDSRKVRSGDIFVAIKGTVHDGHEYIREALERGAAGVVCEHAPAGLSSGMKGKIALVKDSRRALGDMAKRVFGDPSGHLSVYGVTGTNGKTTTVFLIDSILNSAGISSGFISTVFTKTYGDVLNRSVMTTPDILVLNRCLSDLAEHGGKAAVVEISSHALEQQRISGIELNSAVFTNLTPEHLDYHGTMAKYLKDKSMIFGNLKPGGTAVLNADDPLVSGLIKTLEFPSLVTFALRGEAHVKGENVRLSPYGSEFDITVRDAGSVHIRTGLIGEHNIYNMLGAVSALLNSGIRLEDMKEGLEKARPVPGRLDAVATDAPFRVFVDYAHTPNALENVLGCLRALTGGKLICVFGCGGDRDRTKRPVMGDLATSICDNVVMTNDNPRTEKPGDILRQIEKGVSDKNNYCIIEDRHDAIKSALSIAGDGDIVVIAGKGHEEHQIIGGDITHFNDKEVALGILEEMGYRAG
ncbi:MAG: UDP-N-acetylmuramoyl-L-alanyl-D-glutamate--2,6-diaminopimelate ligase [Candidatus Omnitrophota bacterium]